MAPPRAQPQMAPPIKHVTPPHHSQRSFIDGDFDFVSILIYVIAENEGKTHGICTTCMYTCGVSTLYMLFFEVQKLFSLNKILYELYVILLG